MLDILKDEYIILELIPTSTKPISGQMVQLSAIKLKGLELIDRFDYRLKSDKINFKKIIELISYDNESFIYKESEEEIYDDFKKWIDNTPLLYIDDAYTFNYIERYDNKKFKILDFLNEDYDEKVIDRIIRKYNLEPSNYIVDLLYEAFIYESNKK